PTEGPPSSPTWPAATADTPPGTTGPPANPSITTPRRHRNRRIARLPRSSYQLPSGREQRMTRRGLRVQVRDECAESLVRQRATRDVVASCTFRASTGGCHGFTSAACQAAGADSWDGA